MYQFPLGWQGPEVGSGVPSAWYSLGWEVEFRLHSSLWEGREEREAGQMWSQGNIFFLPGAASTMVFLSSFSSSSF